MVSVTAKSEAPVRLRFDDLIGKPFELGGRGPDTYDCWGLVAEMLRRMGQSPPDLNSPAEHERMALLAISQSVSPIWTPCDPKPGAVVTLRTGRHAGHVGMLLPAGQFIHCWERAGGVCVEPFAEWQRRALGFFRLTKP
jgi:cell wall-associated NlpC family hydrolase